MIPVSYDTIKAEMIEAAQKAVTFEEIHRAYLLLRFLQDNNTVYGKFFDGVIVGGVEVPEKRFYPWKEFESFVMALPR